MSTYTPPGTNLGTPGDSSVWFRQNIGPRLAGSTRRVYQLWSGIDVSRLEKHLQDIRARAWQLFEYPCVGQWMFLLPSLNRLPWFESTIEGLKQGPNAGRLVLDLGTFLGQDLRLLAVHGVETDRMRGLDRDERSWKLGFDLFQDQEKFGGQFIGADFMTDARAEAKAYGIPWQDHITSMMPFHARSFHYSAQANIKDISRAGAAMEILQQLQPQSWGVIIAAQFIHLVPLPQQTIVCVRIARISQPGTVVIGYQGGRKDASTSERPWGTMFHHNVSTWRDMWGVVETITGTKWQVEAREMSFEGWGMPREDFAWMADDEVGLDFCCTRIE